MKWISVIVLVIVGVLAAIVAVEYFTVAIHALPSFMGRHHGRGHYRKRGAIAAVIAFVALVVAGYLTYRNTRTQGPALAGAGAGPVAGDSSADQILATDPPEPGGSVQP
jgi:hypothetical protein